MRKPYICVDCSSSLLDVSLSDKSSSTPVPNSNISSNTKGVSRKRMKACSPEVASVIAGSPAPDDLPECIASHLFCDGVIQCGASSDLEFGFDEQNCSEVVEEEAAAYDLDESNIQYEIRYRKRLEDMSNGSDLWLIHYAVLGLAGVVTAILIFSCICYWGIWLCPSSHKEQSDEDGMSQGGGNSECNCGSVGVDNVDMDDAVSMRHLDLETPHRFRSKSLAPSKLKLNPDGSHSFVSYQGNRRLTISVT